MAVGCAVTGPQSVPLRAVPEITERHARGATDQKDAERAIRQFYDANPVLRGREKCVARAFDSLGEKTWDNLARAAISFCLPPPPPLESQTAWVRVATSVEGRSSFVDASRIEPREGNQVSYWSLLEAFNDDLDFQLARSVVDCDRKLVALLQTVSIVSGQYGESFAHPIDWQSVLPNSQGEAIMTAVCAARAEWTKSVERPTPPVRRARPATGPLI